MFCFFKNSFICWFFIYSLVSLSGCGGPEKEEAVEFIIKTPSMIINRADFMDELDLKRTAYPYNIRENPVEYNEMMIHLVNILSEELVLLSAAADKGVIVSDQEIQIAEDEYRKDYPEDSFEQILLKNAISYSFWKKRFKKNMIMDKLIDQELRDKIEITSQDILEFYNKHTIAKTKDPDNNALILNKIEDEKELISRLRMQKTQDQYDAWIQQLTNELPVEIDMKKLKTFLIVTKKNEESKNDKEN